MPFVGLVQHALGHKSALLPAASGGVLLLMSEKLRAVVKIAGVCFI